MTFVGWGQSVRMSQVKRRKSTPKWF